MYINPVNYRDGHQAFEEFQIRGMLPGPRARTLNVHGERCKAHFRATDRFVQFSERGPMDRVAFQRDQLGLLK